MERQLCVTGSFVLLVFLGHVGPAVTCSSGEYPVSPDGRCCHLCDAGFYVSNHCKENHTVSSCIHCPDGTYMDQPTFMTRCPTCDTCSGPGRRDQSPCTTMSNAVCEPSDGFYCVDQRNDGCLKAETHSSCPPGQHVVKKGTSSEDTKCAADAFTTSQPQTDSDHPKETIPGGVVRVVVAVVVSVGVVVGVGVGGAAAEAFGVYDGVARVGGAVGRFLIGAVGGWTRYLVGRAGGLVDPVDGGWTRYLVKCAGVLVGGGGGGAVTAALSAVLGFFSDGEIFLGFVIGVIGVVGGGVGVGGGAGLVFGVGLPGVGVAGCFVAGIGVGFVGIGVVIACLGGDYYVTDNPTFVVGVAAVGVAGGVVGGVYTLVFGVVFCGVFWLVCFIVLLLVGVWFDDAWKIIAISSYAVFGGYMVGVGAGLVAGPDVNAGLVAGPDVITSLVVGGVLWVGIVVGLVILLWIKKKHLDSWCERIYARRNAPEQVPSDEDDESTE